MGKLMVFEWMSLDGVFDADLMNEWWDPYDSADRQQSIHGVYLKTTAFLMGRRTFEMLAPYWSSLGDDEMGGIAGKLNNTPKFVVCGNALEASWQNSTVVAGDKDVQSAIAQIKDDHEETAVIGSAALVESVIRADLVDEYKFLVTPIVMRRGRRLFGEDATSTRMRVLEARTLDKSVLFLQCAKGNS